MAPAKLSSGGGSMMAVVTMDDPGTELGQLSSEFADRAATLIAGA